MQFSNNVACPSFYHNPSKAALPRHKRFCHKMAFAIETWDMTWHAQAPSLGVTVVAGCGIAMAGLHNCAVRAPSWWYSGNIVDIRYYSLCGYITSHRVVVIMFMLWWPLQQSQSKLNTMQCICCSIIDNSSNNVRHLLRGVYRVYRPSGAGLYLWQLTKVREDFTITEEALTGVNPRYVDMKFGRWHKGQKGRVVCIAQILKPTCRSCFLRRCPNFTSTHLNSLLNVKR